MHTKAADGNRTHISNRGSASPDALLSCEQHVGNAVSPIIHREMSLNIVAIPALIVSRFYPYSAQKWYSVPRPNERAGLQRLTTKPDSLLRLTSYGKGIATQPARECCRTKYTCAAFRERETFAQ